MKPRLALTIISLILCIVILSGCATTNNGKAGSKMSVKQLDIELVPTIFDGVETISMNYTNNSSYVVLDVKMEFSPKSDVTEEELKALTEFADSDSSAVIYSQNQHASDPGSTLKNSAVYYKGGHHYASAKLFELVEPFCISIQYYNSDNTIHTLKHDYIANDSTDFEESVVSYGWPDSELLSGLVAPESDIIIVDQQLGDFIWITVYRTSTDSFKEYSKTCKAAGFKSEFDDSGILFDGISDDGRQLSIIFDELSDSMKITMYKN